MPSTGVLAPQPAAVKVPELHHDDIIHIQPHEVWRNSDSPHMVKCAEADVQVDCLLVVGTFIVICWLSCPGECTCVHGAVVYDADDYVERKAVAA